MRETCGKRIEGLRRDGIEERIDGVGIGRLNSGVGLKTKPSGIAFIEIVINASGLNLFVVVAGVGNALSIGAAIAVIGDCRRRRSRDPRLVPPEISGIAVFVWVSGVPESGGSDEAVCFVASRGECGGAADFGVLAGAGAVDVSTRGASPCGEVFRGLVGWNRT